MDLPTETEREERRRREKEKEKVKSPFNIPFPSFLAYAKDLENQLLKGLPPPEEEDDFYQIFGDISPTEPQSTLPTVTNRKNRREREGEREEQEEEGEKKGCKSMTAAERRRANTDVSGRDFVIILFVGSSLWYGIYFGLDYFGLIFFSQIAYFISTASFCIVFGTILVYGLSKIGPIQRACKGCRTSQFGKNLFSERTFVFIHHFLCVFYSFSLCAFILPPLYTLSCTHPFSLSFSPSFYLFYAFILLLTTMWSSFFYQFRCHLAEPGVVSSSSSSPFPSPSSPSPSPSSSSSPPSSSPSSPSSSFVEVCIEEEEKGKGNNEQKEKENEQTQQEGRRFCRTCKIFRPLRSKHCRQCNVCVFRFDHHCLYINNCVGMNNHFSFVFFLCVEMVHVLCMGHILYFTVTTIHEGEDWSFLTVFLTFQIVLTAYCWIGVAMLWFTQFINMLTNWTTNERINHHRYPYLNEKIKLVVGGEEGEEEEKKFCFQEWYEIWVGKSHPFSEGPIKNTISMFNQFEKERTFWDQL